MSILYERTDDYVLTLSDAGKRKLADEQRISRVSRLHAEIAIGSACGGILAIAGLVLKQICGA